MAQPIKRLQYLGYQLCHLFIFWILRQNAFNNSITVTYIALPETLTVKVNKNTPIHKQLVAADRYSYQQKKHSFPKTAYKYFTQLPNFLKV